MNGQPTYNNNNFFTRRNFLIRAALAFSSIPFIAFIINSCKPKEKVKIPGKIVGADFSTGHKLRGVMSGTPSEILEFKYVIVGGGVAGLSAGRWLKKNNIDSFCLLEMEEETGGNSISGKNSVSSYPWGAHYLPIPNNDFPDLTEFLEEAKVITGYDELKRPIYNDYYLCFDPEERLFIHGQWQEGLVPELGVPAEERKQIKDFQTLMDKFRHAKGSDQKYAFAIPVDESSRDKEFTLLDAITMNEFLQRNNFSSTCLNWYIDYCCRDDYGTSSNSTSAWAGIHYFAGRRGVAANADSNTVLVWPEGNAWLVKKIRTDFEKHIKSTALVYSIAENEKGVSIDFFDRNTNTTKRILAQKCIIASPQFVNKRIIKGVAERDEDLYKQFTYAPWFVANITVNGLSQRRGAPLSWDNVFYESKSLGYVNANQQDLETVESKRVLTYYYPLCENDPVTERQKALGKKHEEWMDIMLKDLSKAHKGIEEQIESVDVWVWGHGMIRPLPGFIFGEARQQALKPVNNKLFFAHSDLSGISIFEEAFYQGIRAAKELLNSNQS